MLQAKVSPKHEQHLLAELVQWLTINGVEVSINNDHQ
jgi:hypothetical protein